MDANVTTHFLKGSTSKVKFLGHLEGLGQET